jgi:hypothetical protein
LRRILNQISARLLLNLVFQWDRVTGVVGREDSLWSSPLFSRFTGDRAERARRATERGG